MFDVSIVNRRYFEIKLGDLKLEVEPPKLKVLKKAAAVAKCDSVEAIDGLSDAVSMILNKNKQGIKVPQEIIDELDMDQLTDILTAFFKWLSKEKQSKN